MVNLINNGRLQSPFFIETVVNFMQEGLLVLNALNYIENVNEAAVRVLGHTDRSALVGRHVREIYNTPVHADHFLALLEERGEVELWHDAFIKGNDSFMGQCSAVRVLATGDSAEIRIIFFQDISRWKKSEERLEAYANRLEKKNKELDQFAYIVSHDLKAPLRAISNLSLWLQEDLGPSLTSDNKTNLDMLRGRVQRMEALINGILEYSKIGRQQMSTQKINVTELLHEAVELLSPPSHIHIKWGAMPVLEAPRTMLLQVFCNLIGNAIKYNDKAEGQVNIYAAETPALYEFAVEDNGPGIESEYHEKIFMIFQTLQSRDKFESTGIGLTIVKRILEDWGGKIWVESEPGKGSKFIFNLPKEK